MVQFMSKKIRVLIVEDSLDLREILQRLLRYRAPDVEVVAVAATGAEGIELTREYQPDVVLMDINLPGLDGIEVTKAVRQEVPSSQVILMSGQVGSEDLRRSRLAGARRLLLKPIDSNELISTIRTIYESALDAD
jgi:YesN/AraC family two-component response regulator